MFYAIVGIPLTLYALANLGVIMATAFRFLYKYICCGLCCLCCSADSAETETEAISGTTDARADDDAAAAVHGFSYESWCRQLVPQYDDHTHRQTVLVELVHVSRVTPD